MENIEEAHIEKDHAVRDQFAKLMLATLASFVATKAVEKAYDHLVIERRDTPPAIQE